MAGDRPLRFGYGVDVSLLVVVARGGVEAEILSVTTLPFLSVETSCCDCAPKKGRVVTDKISYLTF